MERRIDLPGGDVVLYTDVNLEYDPDDLFTTLLEIIPWEQRSVEVYGKVYPQPRLIAWYGENSYTYSGLRLEPRPMIPILSDLADVMTRITHCPFNGALLNCYPDGQSSIGMHSDDEPEFGYNPTIASLSLGVERILTFQKKNNGKFPVKIPLPSGSVLVMAGETQKFWKHGISKTKQKIGPRINITFRNIIHPRKG